MQGEGGHHRRVFCFGPIRWYARPASRAPSTKRSVCSPTKYQQKLLKIAQHEAVVLKAGEGSQGESLSNSPLPLDGMRLIQDHLLALSGQWSDTSMAG